MAVIREKTNKLARQKSCWGVHNLDVQHMYSTLLIRIKGSKGVVRKLHCFQYRLGISYIQIYISILM